MDDDHLQLRPLTWSAMQSYPYVYQPASMVVDKELTSHLPDLAQVIKDLEIPGMDKIQIIPDDQLDKYHNSHAQFLFDQPLQGRIPTNGIGALVSLKTYTANGGGFLKTFRFVAPSFTGSDINQCIEYILYHVRHLVVYNDWCWSAVHIDTYEVQDDVANNDTSYVICKLSFHTRMEQ